MSEQYRPTRITIDVTTNSVATALEAVRAFLDELENLEDDGDAVRGEYVIGKQGAMPRGPVGVGTITDGFEAS